jgi:hypothetical protein
MPYMDILNMATRYMLNRATNPVMGEFAVGSIVGAIDGDDIMACEYGGEFCAAAALQI